MAETFLQEDDLSGFFKARVIKNIDPSGEGQIGVFIPDIMPNVTESDTESESMEAVKPATDIFEGHDDFSSNITPTSTVGNFLWCRPAASLVEIATTETAATENIGGSYKIPRLGTWITVFFDNHDPSKPYYLPFSMTAHGEVIAGALLGKASLTAESKVNWDTPETRVLIEVLIEYHNKNVIYIDNNENANSYVIQWANGHSIVVHHAAESGIKLETEKGHTLHLDENSTEFRINTHTNNVSLVYRDSDGTIDIKNTGNYTQKTDGNLNINIAGSANIKAGGTVNIKGATVNLN